MTPLPAHAPVYLGIKPFVPDLADVVLTSLQMAAEEQHVTVAEWVEIRHGAVFAPFGPLPSRPIEQIHVLPCAQVRRLEKVCRVPPVLRVALVDGGVILVVCQPPAGVVDSVTPEVGTPFGGLGNDRIARVFRPLDQQVVAAAGETEAVGVSIVDQDRNTFPADQGAPAVAALSVRSVGIRGQRHRMVDPVHEIGTGGMAPLDEMPVGAVRIILVEDVVPALPKQGPVDIVHPRRRRREMVGGAVRIAGECGGKVAGLPDPRFHPFK